MAELAERVGISRSLLQRIERGDLTCSIGVVFEAAYIVGVPLLHQDLNALYLERHRVKDILSLLPKSVRPTTVEICDDF
ncbi:helix-turn-helix transcriptional regulator [Gluconobacter oxydans]